MGRQSQRAGMGVNLPRRPGSVKQRWGIAPM